MKAAFAATELKRYGPRRYIVLCDEGHSFGLVDNPSGGVECCHLAMIRALTDAYEQSLKEQER